MRITFVDGDEFLCPFCMEQVLAGTFLDDDTREISTGVYHCGRACATFRALDTSDYLAACAARRGAPS